MNIKKMEKWKDVPGYIGLYKASNYGKIKSSIKWRGNSARILKSMINLSGYLFVHLYKNNNQKQYLVHRLVLEAFVGPCPVGMECCHNDGNPKNNFVGNLRWDNRSNNCLDKRKHGTVTNPIWLDNRGSKHGRAKLNDNKIIEIRKLHLEGKSDSEISKIYKVSKSCISHIVNNRKWKHVE